jgi:hypothetical protein
MRPSPLRINRTPSRMRANSFFWRRTATQKATEDAILEVQSPLELDNTPIQEDPKNKAA